MQWKHGLWAAAGLGAGLTAWGLTRKRTPIDFRGKVVLITGGSRGLGLQMAREFGSVGARLIICARDRNELEAARQDLDRRGIPVHTVECDVTDRDQVEGMVKEGSSIMGPIDVLVNNAGVIQVGPVSEMTIQDFEDAMASIFWGTVYTTLAVLPSMRAREHGRVVNITSIGGKISVPHLLPYSCGKFAAVAFSEGLRAELADDGIQVVTIVPGLMRTGSHLNALFKGRHEREYTWFSLGAATPLVSISAERAARCIVESASRGDAEKILSVSADLLARFHGAFPELSAPIMAFVNRFLPSAVGGGSSLKTGHAAEHELNSRLLRGATQMGRRAARRMNEVPVSAT